ncbi:hypothetical protein FRC17_006838, partial [Serendipita sp. 399]
PASLAAFKETEREAIWKAGSIELLSRCWCDFQRTPFFGYHNTTQWEIDSLRVAVDSMNITLPPVQEVEPKNATEASQDIGHPQSNSGSFLQRWFSGSDKSSSTRTGRKWIDTIWREQEHDSLQDQSTMPPLAEEPLSEDDGSKLEPGGESNPPKAAPESSKWLRRKYDLRPHGIDLIVDFGWGESD